MKGAEGDVGTLIKGNAEIAKDRPFYNVIMLYKP